ncbi:hypothetical protein [Actinobaculum sp. 352]|uniref:hypothetical protein n=1 Tax=Actinobaculum sp. 352 TaxID=2490946 RepID=UPI000F7ED515|nr:hypothetical protein [Actinobaculum sp. 352]RTE47734.1 hypothetical protein EKN07_12150 [Actinobaculum sp. 352]
MIYGESVTVITRQGTSTDTFNRPIYVWMPDPTPVPNVVVAPGSTDNLAGDLRPDGVEITLTLHWPRSDTRSLRGCRIIVRGETYTVIGDPQPYTDANTPGPWNRAVPLQRVEG